MRKAWFVQNLILNRYRPIQEAGKGGFATVQVAWDTRIQRRVAIKCIQLDMCGMPDNALDVPGLEEARTAALLSDPTIVGVYDFEIEGDMAYLIMEYVDGVTLTQLMHDVGGPLPMDVISVVFDSVSHALEIAHENQVLHLDIKPDNVLINRQGQVKVTDFGLAQLSHEAGYGEASGGTIGYMPLEQMRIQPPDARTDEWALASMTYEMLSGENPFVAQDLAAAERAIENAELIVPSVARQDVHPAMDDVIFNALAIDREDRYDSIKDFADAIDPFLGDSRKGMSQLAVWIGDACSDMADEDEPPQSLPRLSRMSQNTIEMLYRFGSAAIVSVLGIIGILNIEMLSTLTAHTVLLQLACVAVLVMVCVIKPTIGVIVSIGIMVIALMLHHAYGLGIVFALVAGVWWYISGRKSDSCSACAVTPALVGAFGFGALAPMLTGYVLRVKDAACAAVFSCMVAFVLACAGSLSVFDWSAFAFISFDSFMDARAVQLALSPSTWIIGAAWVLSAVIVSAACATGYRTVAFFGGLAASACLCGAVVVAAFIASGNVSWVPDVWTITTTGVSVGVMTFVTLLGIPESERLY